MHNKKGNLNRIEIVLLILCIIAGFVLRFYTFDHKSLGLDEVHTFNDSRYDLKDQLRYYEANPSYHHPPLFFVMTHLFCPFPRPERDLRIIPLFFGILSIPMIYFLAKQFSSSIALPCTLSLAFMVYHISVSQDGRSYSFVMFIAMAGLYLFMKHLKTSKKVYLPLIALLFSILFYTSYSSVPFIVFFQILWLYRPGEDYKKPKLSSFLLLNSLIFLLCLPWIIFLAVHYQGGLPQDLFYMEGTDSIWSLLYGIMYDWAPHAPLMICSGLLLTLFLFFSRDVRNAIVLLATFLFPVVGLYLFCKLFHINHFIASKYFIGFLPTFLITLYLSLESIEFHFDRLRHFIRLRFLFIILLLLSNLVNMPCYYHSKKQDIKGLVTYLKAHLQDGDKIFLAIDQMTPAILHYFEIYPRDRHYLYTGKKISENEIELQTPFVYKNRNFTIYHSKTCCDRYVADGSRLWIIVDKATAKLFKQSSPSVLKGVFDGWIYHFSRFPMDNSLYLFLWDPKSPDEEGINIPNE